MSEDKEEVETAVEVEEANVDIDLDITMKAWGVQRDMMKYLLKNKSKFQILVKVYNGKVHEKNIKINPGCLVTINYSANYNLLFMPTLPPPPQ